MEGHKKIHRVENRDEDVYYRLGEPIWSSILSLLPLKEAVRTSVLSTSWSQAWKTIPDLDFGIFNTTLRRIRGAERFEWFPYEDDAKYWVKTVDHILHSHAGPIESCCIPIYYSRDISHVVRWIHTLMQRSIQKLEIQSFQDFFYKLPKSLFECESLKALHLKCCDMRLSPEFRLGCKNLRRLELYDTAVDVQTIQRLLSLPKLDSLKLYDCEIEGLSLHIHSPNLQCLHITFHENVPERIRIDAPHLKSLDLQDWGGQQKVEVFAPELERVLCNAGGLEGDDRLRKFLSSISHAKVLVLSGFTKSLQEIEDLPRFPNAKKLTVEVHMSGTKGVVFLSKLLSNCPNLEELEIWNRLINYQANSVVLGLDYWKEQEKFLRFLQFKLKKAVIDNQFEDENVFLFLEFLWKTAKNLKYMIVTSRRSPLLESMIQKLGLKTRRLVNNEFGNLECRYMHA